MTGPYRYGAKGTVRNLSVDIAQHLVQVGVCPAHPDCADSGLATAFRGAIRLAEAQ